MPNWKKLIVSGSSAELSTLKLDGLSAQSSETDVLTINDSSVIGTRQLGSNAFNSTSYLTSINNSNWSGTDLSVANGGTGRSTLSSGQVLLGNGTSGINSRAIGIADNNIVEIDDADAADNDYAKFTANGLEGRSASEVKSDLSLNNVENTALSTYTGDGGALDNQYITNGANYVTAGVTLTTAAQPNITSLGTLTTLTVDDITINGSTISDGGAFTLDVGGDITLDADGADIILKDGGTEFGRFKRDSSDFVIKSATNDKDIVFRGVDNSTTITALTLDMSSAGTATFNNDIEMGSAKKIRWGAGDAQIAEGISENYALEFSTYNGSSMTEALRLSGDNSATFYGNVYLDNVDTNTSSETTALFLNGSTNEVEKRELGSNAFNSTAFTTNTGTVTSVGTNTGLSGTVTTSGNLSLALGDLADMTQDWVTGEDEFIVLDNGTQKRKLSSEIFGSNAFNSTAFTTNTGTVTSVGTNTGLSGTVTTSGNLSLALGDLADMTQTWDNDADEFIVLDGGTQKRKLSSEIFGSNAFNSTAFTTNTGTVTSVAVTVGTGLDVSGSPITTSGTIDIDLDLTEITLGAGLDSTATGLSLDLSELTDMTANVDTSVDELILLDNGAERRKRFAEIFGTAAYKPTTDFLPGNEDGPILLDSTDGTATSDLNLKWDSPVLHVGTTSLGSSELRVQSSDTTQATISAYGSAQGTGRLYVGQSSTYGGGVLYNGDDNPDITSTTDKISFYRRDNGTDTEVFFYGYNSSTVNFIGDVVAFYSSDERLKTNIKPIENTLDKIDRIGGYNFDWVPKEGIHEYEGSDIGVIAQEIEKEFPELVTTREDGYKAVKYEKLTAVLLQAVKDLREEIRECKATK